jgi:DNA-binding MarR family transcriptional regulator
MREWEQLQDEIPTLDMALKFTDRPGVNLRNVNLSVEEWRVVSYINPKNSMRQIAKATNLNDLQIRRIAYSLLQAGLVEIVRPEGVRYIKPPAQQVVQKAAPEEQKSLINRIISRIRSL